MKKLNKNNKNNKNHKKITKKKIKNNRIIHDSKTTIKNHKISSRKVAVPNSSQNSVLKPNNLSKTSVSNLTLIFFQS